MSTETRDADRGEELLAQVCTALATGTPLLIQGGGTKAFHGRLGRGALLDTRGHRGIVGYDPTELVVTARAGTLVAELDAVLDASGQMLAFEPAQFGGQATVGGMVAAGLSGPRRPWAGAVRDFVLGCRVISGHGKHLRFGGEVMKNVAGYDVSRLMAGSLGCLGLLTEVSLKVLPKPRSACTLRLDMDVPAALERFTEWGRQPLPITAACHDGDALMLRLEGGEGSVKAAREALGGEQASPAFWTALREFQLGFFAGPAPLWRISVANDSRPLLPDGVQLVDWGGAQRWLKTTAGSEEVRRAAAGAGGHASCFTPGACDSPLHPLPAVLMRYHRQLKAQLDPQGIFNPGRMYAGL
ncbi:glycolate oxidase subunit GlcE [Thauera linaloolentis]|uniref:Glycolate oxidase FAD binding subunit n=1 Tax=Thauera linaloolentis (strain DSM 12138 / JCM 21573 / CCUG 41526 / CIP 105981 / IAM 15112 / NBRC 102519 / 47Lol) TaxID=1123367 RepID=N6YU51_THAL4|nr:glycolate oxidase subunit GlcE [Thauera linaloolentis]ENO85698.1 glycolate oxidase FAD binding subunit [Thauera linaloolentis 47Lol = DSM 12138]MCM8566679.1 glycolate oxidase subunit GlcE [Thauera linaloolentis]